MLEDLCGRPLGSCFGLRLGRANGGDEDELAWRSELKPHAFGHYAMAVVQANSSLEDQAQVLSSPSSTFIGVFDGHGGPSASRFVNSHLFSFLQEYAAKLDGAFIDALQKAFRVTEEHFLQLVRRNWETHPEIAVCGSCCLVGAIYDGTLYTANLGDSRAVLGCRVSEGGMSAAVQAVRLTSDHNVGIEKVRQEVQALHPDDSHIVVYKRGSWRIKGIIQVSRSIGDVYLKSTEFNTLYQKFGTAMSLKRAVVSAEPSISSRKLKPDDLFLIFASDGFWEHTSDQAAVELVNRNQRFGIATRLARVALREAARKTGINYEDMKKVEKGVRRHLHDDITVIVVYLDDPQMSPGSTRRKGQGVYVSSVTPADVGSYNADVSDYGLTSVT